jgi:glycosyltransferase involved in cell wall biosynthesis
MNKILINGDFLCRHLTGIERYAYEITMRLDVLSQKDEIAIIIPTNTKNIPKFNNLTVIRHKKIKSHFFWQMFTLQFFLLLNRNYIILEFGNAVLPFAPGIVFLHDIYCELFPKDFVTIRDKIIRLYNRIQYRLIVKYAKRIVTVSEFSKNQIIKTYHVNPDKINVIYSSWNHFKTIQADYSIFKKYPELSAPFYFSLGSLSKRKNIKWIIEYAIAHKDKMFVLSGKSLPTVKSTEINDTANISNILLLGYLDDNKVKALMEKCKAFLLPSYYEGFGLTPLEALSCGARIIISNAASLPEIYGNTAYYIDPFDTNIDIDELLKNKVENPSAILEKYSYDTSAQETYKLIKECIQC